MVEKLLILSQTTHARFYTRATSRKELDILTDRVGRIAKGAAIQTDVTMNLVPYKMVLMNLLKHPN